MLHWFQGTVSFNLFLPLKRRKMLTYFCANPPFLCPGWGLKITGYPCNIKMQQKKTTLEKNTKTVLASCLEDLPFIENTGCRAWIQRPKQGLCLWLPKGNSRAPRNLPLTPHLPGSGAPCTGTCFLITAGYSQSLEPRWHFLINLGLVREGDPLSSQQH